MSNIDIDNSSISSSGSDETELIKTYEKTRKSRSDRNENITEVAVDPEYFNKIKISQKELKNLKPKLERTAKQKEASKENGKKLLDLRKDKTSDAKIILQVEPKKTRTIKKKAVNNVTSKAVEVIESEEEEEVKPKLKRSTFQCKKPKIEESDEEDPIESKLKQLKQIDTILQLNNPYYSLIMNQKKKNKEN